jgi:hypothetical protein
MTLLRHAAREDANRAEIVAALKACGWICRRIKWPCDLLITKPGRHMLMAEIKATPKSKLTKAQKDAITDGFSVVVLRSVADVLRLSGVAPPPPEAVR